MIIYLCIKFESSTLIVSNDIEWKPFFKVENFSKLKKAHNSQNYWWILPEIELDLHFNIYISVYKNFNPIHQSFQKISHGNHLLRTGRTDGMDLHTDSGDTICPIMPPPPPTENGRGIKKCCLLQL